MIRAEAVNYAIGTFALNTSLEIGRGEYFVLLGSTGSGKTIFLECLCGLREGVGGAIWIDESDVAGSEPADRNIGYVPQDGALFNHLDVRGNIAFGPRVRGMSRAYCEEKVAGLAQTLGIEHLLDRRIVKTLIDSINVGNPIRAGAHLMQTEGLSRSTTSIDAPAVL